MLAQLIVELGAKPSGRDGALELATVVGGDDADVQRDLRPVDVQHVRLDEAQQARLRDRAEIGDAVDEQRAVLASGQRVGAGEQMLLEVLLRERRGVDGDERLALAHRPIVNRTRDHGAARAVLGLDAQRSIALRDRDDLLEEIDRAARLAGEQRREVRQLAGVTRAGVAGLVRLRALSSQRAHLHTPGASQLVDMVRRGRPAAILR